MTINLFRCFFSLILGIPLLLATMTTAKAIPIGLGLAIDGSGSISSSNFALQRDAYVSVLDSVLDLTNPDFEPIAISVHQFATGVSEIFPLTVIDSQTAKDNLLNAISNMSQLGTSTNISGAIDTIANALLNFSVTLDRKIIDVSTDGIHNVGSRSPSTAASEAVSNGVNQVNCLGIGAGANCGFIAGTGSFSIIANNFNDFADALETKLNIEVGGDPTGVPEPGTLVLLFTGIIGLGFIARRKSGLTVYRWKECCPIAA